MTLIRHGGQDGNHSILTVEATLDQKTLPVRRRRPPVGTLERDITTAPVHSCPRPMR